MESETKKFYRQKYKNIKKYGSASVIAGVGITEGTKLVKNVINSKLKAYGYKSLFAITLGSIIQFVLLLFYVFTYGSKLKKYALTITEISAKISKREIGIFN